MYPNVHSITIYNSQDMKTTQMSMNRWVDKGDVVHIYNGILLSQKMNVFESAVVRWMNVKPVILGEVRKKKQISYINTIYQIQKMVLMNLILGKERRCRYRNGLVRVKRSSTGYLASPLIGQVESKYIYYSDKTLLLRQ